MRRFSIIILCGTAVVLGFPPIGGGGDEIQESRTLFRPVNEKADLHPEVLQHVERIKKLPSTASPAAVRVIVLQPDELKNKSTSLRFNLPDGKTLMQRSECSVDESYGAKGAKSLTWGKVETPRELVQLSFRGKSGTGLIYTGGKVYSVEPLRQGLHAIAQVDQSKFPKGHTKGFEAIEKRSEKKRREEGREVRFVLAKDPVTVRVLVAYTPAVEKARGGQEQTLSLIDAMIDLANRSYRDSRIGVRLQLASTSVKVEYQETGDLDSDLAKFRDMDDIKKLRKENKADICVMLVDSPAYTGVSSSILADSDSAFSVVDHVAAVRFLAFPHEIGHLQGARHEDDMNPDSNYKDNHGYTIGKEAVTMMAYPAQENQIRILRWSSPNQDYAAGIPLGTRERSNNVRVLNDTAERTSRLHP